LPGRPGLPGWPGWAGWPGWPIDFCGVEGEVDGRAFAYLALGPCAAAVTFHDLPDAGEADACAGELAGRVQPLEWLEQFA
jgi:hypothetical protein